MADSLETIQALEGGQCIAFPTEGVWGLGCDPKNEEAVSNLRRLKKRDLKKGLVLVASHLSQLNEFVDIVKHKDKMMTKWPGHHTWIVDLKEKNKFNFLGFNGFIAVRLSAHKTIRELCSSFNGAIVSTSANYEGNKPASTEQEVRKLFPNVVIIKGDLGGHNKPSSLQYLDSEEWVRR